MATRRYDVWGSELSPFTLKLLLLLRAAGFEARLLPAEGTLATNVAALARVMTVRRGWRRPTFPPFGELGELPLVPYLLGPDGEVVVDSSAAAEWIDARSQGDAPRLMPPAGAERVAARLVDEYLDEMGLYFAHHNRWVVSAATNDAGERLAAELRTFVPRALRPRLAERFSARQVRRLPYLFSVAPAEPDRYDLPPSRRPPGRIGFPPTHELLDTCFRRLLDCLESLFRAQPYVLADAFTIADASVYGQLAMNLDDPSVAAMMELRAPTTVAWVRRLRSGEMPARLGPPRLTDALRRLMAEIESTFVPLMRQNDAAYEVVSSRRPRRRNEAAFDRGECLYDGELLGRPFRAVVKTFQVDVWRRLLDEWRGLPPDEAARLPIVLE